MKKEGARQRTRENIGIGSKSSNIKRRNGTKRQPNKQPATKQQMKYKKKITCTFFILYSFKVNKIIARWSLCCPLNKKKFYKCMYSSMQIVEPVSELRTIAYLLLVIRCLCSFKAIDKRIEQMKNWFLCVIFVSFLPFR